LSGEDARRESDSTGARSEDQGYVLEPTKIEVGSGYTFSVRYDENENPVIDLKTYGNVNIRKIVKEIQHAFPKAQIRKINEVQTFIAVKKNKTQKIRKKP
jgi:hypothetical protein